MNKPLSKTPSWQNQHAVLLKRLQITEFDTIRYTPVRQTDQVIGTASEYALRLASEVRRLEQLRKDAIEQYGREDDPERRNRLRKNIAGLEAEVQLMHAMFAAQIHFDTGYKDEPLFTLRGANSVVIRKSDKERWKRLESLSTYDPLEFYKLQVHLRLSPLADHH